MKPSLGAGLAFCLVGVASAQTGWILRPTTVAPSARAWHDVAYDVGRGVTVLFGGWDPQTYLNDTWEWDGVVWTQRTPANAPSPRCVHAMAYDLARGRVVLFGGVVGSGSDTDETWEYDGVTWTQMQPSVHPSSRRNAKLAFDPVRGVCVLFGGGISGSGSPVLDDTWEWNGATWTQFMPTVRPPARWGHFLVADWTGRVVLFGGAVGASQHFNDTWTWDGAVWQQLTPTMQPTARREGASAFDSLRGAFVSWGGSTASSFPSATWVWDGGNWRLDPRPTTPSGRRGTAAAFDLARGQVVLFGGWSSQTYQDTWEYVVGPLATCATSGPGCAGTSGVPSLAPLAGALPVLGTTWTLRIGYGTGSGVAALAVGLSDQAWSGGPLPLDLAALGMPGCALRVSTDFVGGVVMAGGYGSVPWTLPSSPSLAGVVVFAQALVLAPGANPFGAVMSNALAASTGPY